MTDVTEASYEILLKARDQLRVIHHDPGRIRLRFSPKILTSVPELRSEADRDWLTSIPGIARVKTNLVTFSLTISYDPAVITPDAWERVLSGSDNEARAVLEAVCGGSDS